MADYEKVAAQLADLDIGMLFLNAGGAQPAPFIDLSAVEVESIVNLNTIHPVYLLKALLP